MSTIKLKRSAVPGKSPTVENLDLGEIAVNTYDGKLYTKKQQTFFDDALQENVSIEEVVEFTSKIPVENTLYVQKAGSDNYSGESWDGAFLTIEKAVEAAKARNQLTLIKVGPGEYTTRGHIDVPDNTVIQGVHRAVFVKPESGYEERNVFRIGSGCFVEGFVFEGFRLDSLDNPSEGFAICFRPGARITRVPYAHKIAVRTPPYWSTIAPPLDRDNANPLVGRGAGVVLADAAVLDPDSIFPNIMAWGATPVTHNGIGYCAKNGGLINAINAISIWCHKHFLAIDGGQIVLSACSTQFGDYTLVSQGSRDLILPTQVDINLEDSIDTTAATAITENANTIANTVVSQLETNSFTTNWPSDGSYQALTQRDTGLLTQSLAWVLQTGDEQPMLDYAKGFFTTTGDRAFKSLPYNYDKCYRDTGLITEAVAYDIAFGSNYRSINAALSYYRANANEVLTSQLSITLQAIQKQKEIAASYLDGTSLTRSNALFDEILDIVENGTGAVDDYVYPAPTSYDTGFENARELILANKEFIQDEIDAWIEDQIASSTAPFDGGFTYDGARATACRRDVGLIIDALIYDLTYGGNLETYNAAISYFVGATSQLGVDEKNATLAAYTRLKDIVGDISQKVLITKSTNNTGTQDTTIVSAPGSTEARNFAEARIQEISDTISSDGTPPTKINPDLSWAADEFTISYDELITNKDEISDEVLTYLSTIETGYNFDKCYRDVKLINEAIAYDVLFDSNVRSINAALSYYRANANKVLGEQKAITIEAIQAQKGYLEAIIDPASTDTLTRTTARFTEILDILENGEGSADTYSLPDPTGYADGFRYARDFLFENKVFIQDEIDAWILDQIANSTPPFAGFTYTGDRATKCRRDIGLIVEAIRYDLTYGGNLETYNAAVAYFVGTEAQYGTGEKAPTLAALQRLKDILPDILSGTSITPSSGNSATQDTTAAPFAGSADAIAFAVARVENIITTITEDGEPPAKILPDTTWPLQEFQDSFADITTNTNEIAKDVLRDINVDNKTLFGAFLFAWETIQTEIKALNNVSTATGTVIDNLFEALYDTIINPSKTPLPSVITAVGHTWTGIMAGVALTKIPPAGNQNSITESLLELDGGTVIASGQDDEGSALFIGGMQINADTGELTGPPFETAVNRIATRTAIARSF